MRAMEWIRMDEAVAKWVRLARRDIESSRILLEAGDVDNARFLCQQAVEKALKALVQERMDDPPPKIHSLMKLSQLSGLWGSFSDGQRGLVLEVDPHVVTGRYGLSGVRGTESVGEKEASRLIASSRELIGWLLARLS